MKLMRTKTIHKGDPGLIATADWHIRQDKPLAYVGDFLSDQWEAMDFVAELQREHDCPVIHAGDLYNNWKPSPWLLSKTIEHLPNDFWTVYGNHDLPQHNIKLKRKCGIFTLATAQKLHVLPQGHWGNVNLSGAWSIKDKNIFAWHLAVFKSKEPAPGYGQRALKVLRDNPDFDVIITGDNHTPFVEMLDDRFLINPGSLMRQTAAQIDFHPRVYLWYPESNTIQKVELPFREDAISREHLETKEKRDTSLSIYIEHLDGDWSTGIEFEGNVASYVGVNKVEQDIVDIINKSFEITKEDD
jgi:predicted phosphodiesterase